jgi:hypothetical protein
MKILGHCDFIYLFEQLDRRKEEASFVIKASYLEIYNEKENMRK